MSIDNGSIVKLERFTYKDSKISVLNVVSSTIKIPYDDKMIPLNIYLHNNGYTTERAPFPKLYYPIWPGAKWEHK